MDMERLNISTYRMKNEKLPGREFQLNRER